MGRIYGFDSRINGEFVQEPTAGLPLVYLRPKSTLIDFAKDGFGALHRYSVQLCRILSRLLPNDPTTRLSLTLMVGVDFWTGRPWRRHH